jgi:Leucine-rich repeat (LRR) protein
MPDPSLLSGFTNITDFQLKEEDVHPEYCPSNTKNPAFNKICSEVVNKSDLSDDLTTECQTNLKDDGALAHTFQTLITVTEAKDCRDLKEILQETSILHLEQQELIDISPLGHAVNLRELYLDYNKITDISVLSKLNKLQILWIDDNEISDLSSLSDLNLLWLSAGDNVIANVEPLKSQKNLINLWLGANQIQDITPLSSLVQLKKLHLAKNQIEDVGPLSDLKSLQKVYLAENQIQDFTPILDLPHLSFLTEGLDYEESPLEAHRWFLSGNPISPDKCETPDTLPLILSMYCYDAK